MTNKEIMETCEIFLERGDAECDEEYEDFLKSTIKLAKRRDKQKPSLERCETCSWKERGAFDNPCCYCIYNVG